MTSSDSFSSEALSQPEVQTTTVHEQVEWQEASEEEFINEYLRPVTVTVSDGNSFKTVIGDQPMTPGGRYYFEIKVNSGYLIKVGVCRQSIDSNKVIGHSN